MTQLSDDELKKKLTPEQYHVLKEEGTERPFTGKYLYTKDKGVYKCGICGAVLFDSGQKFESGSGWPSFHDVLSSDAVKLEDDLTHGMHRIKVSCAKCGGHLGHVFDDSSSDTGQMFCINSASLDFEKSKPDSK